MIVAALSPDSVVLACVVLVMLAFVGRAVISRLTATLRGDPDALVLYHA